MTVNKNQHFVPRCHLKPFTVGGENLAIHLFNLAQRRSVSLAPVKNQCSKDYFYGQDEKLETAIQTVEGYYGQIVADLFKRPQTVSAGHKTVLRRFALLQAVRTEAYAHATNKMTAGMTDVPGVSIERLPVAEAIKGAVQAAMLEYAGSMGAIDDLKVCILRNRTDLPFMTSDNPAVLTNRWYAQDARAKTLSYGFLQCGTILILPLSPSMACVMYDGDVYTVANSYGWLDIRATADVRLLNELQVLNCNSNVYFGDWNDEPYIAEQCEAGLLGRPSERVTVIYAVPGDVIGEHRRYGVVPRDQLTPGIDTLVHAIYNRPVPSGWPSFLKFRGDGRVYGNDTRTGFIRRWCLQEGYKQNTGFYGQRARIR